MQPREVRVSYEISKIFKAVADATRRQILDVLRQGELSAGAIAKRFEMTKPAISHHLAALKEAGLVTDKRKGQRIIYSVKRDSIIAIWDCFLGKFSQERSTSQTTSKTKSKGKKGGARKSK
jgi:DNA-binding transcriptional ArsR family regulator